MDDEAQQFAGSQFGLDSSTDNTVAEWRGSTLGPRCGLPSTSEDPRYEVPEELTGPVHTDDTSGIQSSLQIDDTTDMDQYLLTDRGVSWHRIALKLILGEK